jgi:hypothetical protein
MVGTKNISTLASIVCTAAAWFNLIACFSRRIRAFKDKLEMLRDLCMYPENSIWRRAGVHGVIAMGWSELEIGTGDFAKKHLGVRFVHGMLVVPANDQE